MSAAERFYVKTASLASILPSVAGPAVGGFAGYNVGGRFGHPELGALLGTISLGTAGKLLVEKVEQAQEQQPQMPPGAPYAIDPTAVDIPPWALQGAQMLQPLMKQSSAMDWILGEVPGANVVQRGMTQGLGGAGRAFAGMALGGVPGSLLGMGVGKGIEHLAGRNINIPGIRITLPELLAGLGGTIGATKGLQHLAPEQGH